MSTIEKILESLERTSQDKKSQLSKSYQEKSVWLRNEFAVIKQLIKQNPRDNIRSPTDAVEDTDDNSLQTKEELFSDRTISSANARVVENEAPSSSSVSFIPLSESAADDAASRKRKSPEQEINATKLSPEQKRVSFDIEEILTAAGLPTDLNRLKKEQLLAALEERDPTTELSMKSLKKDLIDAVRDVLLEEHRQQCKNNSNEAAAAVFEQRYRSESTGDAPQATSSAGTGTPGASARKVSLMSDFRSRVQRESQIGATDAATGAAATAAGSANCKRMSMDDPDWKKKIEKEYHSRMSQVRKSIVTTDAAAVVAAVKPSEPQQELTTSMASANSTGGSLVLNAVDLCSTGDSQIPSAEASDALLSDTIDTTASVTAPAEDAEEEENPAGATAVEDGTTQDDSGDADDEQEQQSPATSSAEDDDAMEEVAPAEDEDDKSVASEATNATAGVWMEVSSPLREANNNSHNDAPAAKAAVALVAGSTTTTAVKGATSATAATGILKGSGSGSSLHGKQLPSKSEKSSAAVGGAKMTSFQTAQSKPVIPSLVKANRLKLAEEQKAMQKKKDKELKHQQQSTATASSMNSSTGNQKSTHGLKPATAKPTATGATAVKPSGSSTTTAEAPAAADKPVATTAATVTQPSTTPAAANTVAVAPVAVAAPAVVAAPTAATASPAPEKKKVGGIFGMFSNAVNSASKIVSANAYASSAGAQPSSAEKKKLQQQQQQNIPLSKPLVPGAASAMNPPAAPVASPKSKAPIGVVAASSGVLKDITASVAVASTVAKVQLQKQQMLQKEKEDAADEYIIEDRESSDDDGSGTDDEKEHKKKAQSIPDWARGSRLKEQLERQYGLVPGVVPMDPDSIFPEVQSCNLEEIFGCARGVNRKYAQRTSSAHWDADKLTIVEKRAYRNHMGYDRHLQQQQQQHSAGSATAAH